MKIFEEAKQDILTPTAMFFYDGEAPTIDQTAKFLTAAIGLEVSEAAPTAKVFIRDYHKGKGQKIVRTFITPDKKPYALAMDNKGTAVLFSVASTLTVRERKTYLAGDERVSVYADFVAQFTPDELEGFEMLAPVEAEKIFAQTATAQ